MSSMGVVVYECVVVYRCCCLWVLSSKGVVVCSARDVNRSIATLGTTSQSRIMVVVPLVLMLLFGDVLSDRPCGLSPLHRITP